MPVFIDDILFRNPSLALGETAIKLVTPHLHAFAYPEHEEACHSLPKPIRLVLSMKLVQLLSLSNQSTHVLVRLLILASSA